MDLRVTIKGMDGDYRLRSRAAEKVVAALHRFQDRVRSVRVLLEDVTGPHKQVVDKRCRIDVCLKRGGDLRIDEVRADLGAALATALDRLKASVSRKVAKRKRGVGAG